MEAIVGSQESQMLTQVNLLTQTYLRVPQQSCGASRGGVMQETVRSHFRRDDCIRESPRGAKSPSWRRVPFAGVPNIAAI